MLTYWLVTMETLNNKMLASLNATERTLPEFKELFSKGGWKLVKVNLPGNGLVAQGVKIIGIPAGDSDDNAHRRSVFLKA